MNKTIYSRFDKKAITDLPIVTFPGRVITIITPGRQRKLSTIFSKATLWA